MREIEHYLDPDPDADPIELLTPAEMGRADSLTIQGGVPGSSLMLRAGKNVAAAAADLLRPTEGRKVAVFCGPGNNGGDGYVAGRLLREQGFGVEIGVLGDPSRLTRRCGPGLR